jgi:hypothetical protein
MEGRNKERMISQQNKRSKKKRGGKGDERKQ